MTIVIVLIALLFPTIPAVGVVVGLRSADPPRERGFSTAAVACWGVFGGAISAAAWLSWEVGFTEYPNGNIEGPYGFWQVVGTASCALIVCILGAAFSRRIWSDAFTAAASTTLSYALVWALIMSQTDGSGLFLVGMIYLIVAGGFGLTVVAGLIAAVRAWRSPRSAKIVAPGGNPDGFLDPRRRGRPPL